MTSYVEQLDKAERTIAALREQLATTRRLNERLTLAVTSSTEVLVDIRGVCEAKDHSSAAQRIERIENIIGRLRKIELPPEYKGPR
jgi:hypothetical protein